MNWLNPPHRSPSTLPLPTLQTQEESSDEKRREFAQRMREHETLVATQTQQRDAATAQEQAAKQENQQMHAELIKLENEDLPRLQRE